jgi:hypothetical protein
MSMLPTTDKVLRKEQVFAHRVVEFADKEKCIRYFEQNQIDFMLQNDQGWTILMSICACGKQTSFLSKVTNYWNCY